MQVARAVELEKELIEVAVDAIRLVHSAPQTLQCAQTALELLLGLMGYIAYEGPLTLAAATMHLLPSMHQQPKATPPSSFLFSQQSER